MKVVFFTKKPPPMKTKEKVEQGKETADHLMPLGFLLSFIGQWPR